MPSHFCFAETCQTKQLICELAIQLLIWQYFCKKIRLKINFLGKIVQTYLDWYSGVLSLVLPSDRSAQKPILMQQVCLKVCCCQCLADEMRENFAFFWSHDQSLITNNRFLKTKCLLRVQPNIYFTKSGLFWHKDKSKAGYFCKGNSINPVLSR